MKMQSTSQQHEELYQELCAVMLKYEKASMPPTQLVAIAAQIVGRLMACLDPLEVTESMAVELVLRNIESGNIQMVQQLLKNQRD